MYELEAVPKLSAPRDRACAPGTKHRDGLWGLQNMCVNWRLSQSWVSPRTGRVFQAPSIGMGSGLYLAFDKKDLLTAMGLFSGSELVQSPGGGAK